MNGTIYRGQIFELLSCDYRSGVCTGKQYNDPNDIEHTRSPFLCCSIAASCCCNFRKASSRRVYRVGERRVSDVR